MTPTTTHTPPSKRCVAIINPASGSGRSAKTWARVVGRLRDGLRADGWQLEERFTAAPGAGESLALEAARGGADVVLAVGGDGSIHEVVAGLLMAAEGTGGGGGGEQGAGGGGSGSLSQQQHARPALAVLPAGTGSDFARTFGFEPNDADAARARIAGGRRRALDVGRVELYECACALRPPQQQPQQPQPAAAATTCPACGRCSSVSPEQRQQPPTVRYVANLASCGVGAVAAASAGGLKFLGPLLAYQAAALVGLFKWRRCAVDVRVMSDGGSSGSGNSGVQQQEQQQQQQQQQPWQRVDDLTLLVAGNGKFWGAGMRALPKADPSDGLLDVVLAHGIGLWWFVTKGHHLRNGTAEGQRGVRALPPARRVEVVAATAAAAAAGSSSSSPSSTSGRGAAGKLPLECDGEWQGEWGAIAIEALPGALQLCV